MIGLSDNSRFKKGFRLGDWYINPLAGTFTRNGHSVHVEPKLMDVLLCLAGANGELVTREKLMESVWSGLVVSEEALTRCISELRTLLGDTARERRYIRTVPKRGYSLLPPAQAAPAGTDIAPDPQMHKGRQHLNAIAVLPFVNLGPGNDDYFSDGLSEELINALARFTQLRVAARTSVFSFKGRPTDVKLVGKELNVSYILEGSVRIAADKLRINAQLISVADGFQLWAETFDRNLTDVFNIQAEIAGAVARELNLKIGRDSKSRRGLKPGTENLEAYKWYLHGRRKFQTEQSRLTYTGEEELVKAVELDPDFADAYGLLAYLNLLNSTVRSYHEVAASSRTYLNKALALDPEQPEALMAKAIDTRWLTWDWRAVYRLFDRALQAAPNHPNVLTQFACRFYRDLGSLDRAEELLWRAIEIDPLNAGHRSALSYVLRYNRRSSEAIKHSELAMQLSPQYGYAHLGLILALIAEHEYTRALDRIEEAEKFFGRDFSTILVCRGRLYAQSGAIDKAMAIKARMLELVTGNEGLLYQAEIGWLCIALGELAEGVRWLNRTLDSQNSQVLVSRVAVDIINDRFTSNRSQPVFQDFLRRMNMDDQYVEKLKLEGLLT